MPEAGGANIEVAHHLHEKEEQLQPHAPSHRHQALELIEAIILALVAVTTAWSGYQAARWDANQSVLYGRSSRLRVEGQALDVESNQAKQYNASTVVEWLKAEAHEESKLAGLFERRMLPEFRPAFEAWKKTDPLHNPNAPVGPTLMPQYRDARGEEAARKNNEATELFEQGTRAREIGDGYVRVTVGLATVLFLVAMSQRFKSQRIRVMLVAMAFVLLCFPLWRILTLPRT
jgi:heme/copper-type cytochrome/quinol oxidase subunit 4